MRQLLAFLISSSFLVGFSACEKKRTTTFTQGDGENIYSVEAYDGKTFELQTGEVLAPGKASKADLLVQSESSLIRSFDAVTFEAQTDLFELSNELLNNFDFFGKANHTYTMQMKLTEDNLVVFKIASAEDLPSQELTYAVKQADGRYAVPILGYPMRKYKVENIKDSRGKSTDKVASFPKDFLKDATHFKINETGVRYFSHEEKLDLVPASYFDPKDEWFYEFTIIDRPISTNNSNWMMELGTQLGSGKLRFNRYNNSVVGVDINVPTEAEELEAEKLPTIIEIPAKWSDFRPVTTGSNAYLEEEILTEFDEGAQNFMQRAYGMLDFSDVNNLGSEGFGNIKVTRLEVEKDFLSFVLYDSLNGLKIHFSFVKDKNKVAGRNYPIEDLKRYGYFRTVRSYYNGELTQDEDFLEKSLYLLRMYPENNEITFYLTEDSPSDQLYVEAVQAAVDAWDQAFVEAARESGVAPLRVKLNLDKRVLNGDVRYNKVAFYGYDIASGLLGMGPSVADSRNGHVYSSTNNIYLRNYREGLLRKITLYIRDQLGLYEGKYASGVDYPQQTLGLSAADENTSAMSQISGFESANSSFVDGELDVRLDITQPTQSRIISPSTIGRIAKHAKTAAKSIREGDQVNTEERFPAVLKRYMPRGEVGARLAFNHTRHSMANLSNSFEDIENLCMGEGDSLKSYFNDLSSARESDETIFRLNNEQEIFYECAQKLMKPTLISTLVHEFGHNFGLTHNFRGTADFVNFPRNEEGVPTVRSTSVMDYAHTDSDRGFVPGPYDIAAVRYGYYNMVELDGTDENGQRLLAKIPEDENFKVKSITQSIASGQNPRGFKYCWDYDIDSYTQTPIEYADCRRWDRGSNPVQMVLSKIDQFQAHVASWGYRFDEVELGGGNFSYTGDLLAIRHIYDRFRYLVMTNGRPDDKYMYYVGMEGSFDSELNKVIDPEGKLEWFVPLRNLSIDELKAFRDGDLEDTYGRKALPTYDAIETERIVENLPVIQQYKLASDIAFRFFNDLANSEVEYCLAQNDKGKVVGIRSFEELRRVVFLKDKVTIDQCADALGYFQAELKDKKVSSVSKFGNRLNNTTYSADESSLAVKSDIAVGFKQARDSALEMLTSRLLCFGQRSDGSCAAYGNLYVNLFQSFVPNFLDNPNYRALFIDRLEKRIRYGVDIEQRIIENELASIQNKAYPAELFESKLKELQKRAKAGILGGNLVDGSNPAITTKSVCVSLRNSTSSYDDFSATARCDNVLPGRTRNSKEQERVYLERYSEESTFYATAWYWTLVGLDVPGQEQGLRISNLIPWTSRLDLGQNVPSDAALAYDLQYLYYATPEKPFIYNIINEYNETMDLIEITSSLPQSKEESKVFAERLNALLGRYSEIFSAPSKTSDNAIMASNYEFIVQIIGEYVGLLEPEYLADILPAEEEANEEDRASQAREEDRAQAEVEYPTIEEILNALAATDRVRSITIEAIDQIIFEINVNQAQVTEKLIETVVESVILIDYPSFDPDKDENDRYRKFQSELQNSAEAVAFQTLLGNIQEAMAAGQDPNEVLGEGLEALITQTLESVKSQYAPYSKVKTQLESKAQVYQNVIGLR